VKPNTAIELELTNKVMQDVIRGEDGFFVYWPERVKRQGYLNSHLLRFIADILDKLNEPLLAELDKYFASGKETNAITQPSQHPILPPQQRYQM